MAYLLDTFTGSAAAALVGHAPQVGATWLGTSPLMYPGSDVRLSGAGYVYNAGNTVSGTSSLILNPTTFTGTTHVVVFDMLFATDLGSGTAGVGFFTGAASPTDNRLYYDMSDKKLRLSRGVTGAVVADLAFPTPGTAIRFRVTLTDSTTRSFTCESSTDAGANYTTLFGGAQTYPADANAFAPAIWFDNANSGTTGVLVGGLRVDVPAAPTAGTFTGPSTGVVGADSTAFNVTLNVPAPFGGTAVTLSGGGAGTFTGTNVSGTTLTIPSGQTGTGGPGSFTYNKPTAGLATLTPTASGVAMTPSSLGYTATSSGATSFSLSGPPSGYANNASSAFTVTPNGVETGTFTPTPVAGVTFAPATLTWSGDGSAKTFTVTKVTAATVSVNGTFSNGLTAPSALSYTFNPQTLAASPSSIATSATTTVTFTELGGKFLTTPPTLGAAGVAGVTVGSVTVVDDTHATAPVTAGTTTGTVTYTDTSVAAGPTATQSVAAPTIDGAYFTQVVGFTPGLTAVSYRFYNAANTAVGAVVTAGITERAPGTYAATATIPGNVAGDVRWNSGESSPVYASDAYNPPGATATVSGTINANLVSVNGVAAQEGDKIATAAGTNTITFPTTANLTRWKVRILRADTGADQSRRIIASNTGTGQQTVDADWSPVPTGAQIVCQLSDPMGVDYLATDAITAASLSAGAVTKTQAGLATPTNITAGTITTVGTVTNLTNAATAGDFTTAQKTTLAGTPVGNVTLAATQPFYAPARAGDSMSLLPTAFNSVMVEPNYNVKQVLKVVFAAVGNTITGNGTTSVTVGGATLPAPTPGSATVINVTMAGVLPYTDTNGVAQFKAVDRSAINSVQLSAT